MIYSKRLSSNVIELYGGLQPSSNVYIILSKKLLIDLGSKMQSKEMIAELSKYISPLKVRTIIFTHLHFDHTGDPSLFKNAKFYASKEEIESLKKPITFTNPSKLKKIKLNHLGSSIESLKVIKTPGHTIGSICLWKEDDKILFTGDTLFSTGAIGRTDLPTSVPEKMQASLMKLINYNYRILAPGHILEHGKLL